MKPSPTGVVTGPFSATLLVVIESSSVCGRVWPVFSTATTPASCVSQSIATPAAFRMRTTAAVTSGPMPSPGMRVMRCAMDDLAYGVFTTRMERSIDSAVPQAARVWHDAKTLR